MALNYFKSLRKSVGIKILFSSVLSNLVVFGQPMQEMVLDYYSKKNIPVKTRYSYNNIGNRLKVNEDAKTSSSDNQMYSEIKHSEVKSNNVFYAKQSKGTVGKSFESEVDNPYDNFFTIHLPDNIDLKKYEATLAYELNGVANASQTTKSINNFPSYGGKTIVATEQWTEVKETICASYLNSGSNEIFFNRRVEENYQYSVRNLRIELREKNNEPVNITEKTLTNFKGNVYLVGTVSTPDIKAVHALGITIPVDNGVFEHIFTDVSNNTKEVEVSYVNSTNKWDAIKIPVLYQNGEIEYQFTESKLENNINTFLIDGSDSHQAIYNGICVNIEEGLSDTNFGKLVIEGLKFKDIRTLNDDIENVTGGAYPAYRIKKHNLSDSIPMQLHMKYDMEQIPEGYTARDIKTFYFDKNTHAWKALSTYNLDFENNEIISTAYANETDYINGVIKVPDSPETGSFAPTTISDMKLADPSAGVVSIAPPSPNSTGVASTSFPLKLPQGRNGMQPSLEVNYNSEGGNGWMGIGWNLNTPAITLNTKWGVPTYTFGHESEIYSLNGADLVLKDGATYADYTNPHRKANITRTSERIFYPRKEGGYQKIIRHGSDTKNYWWEVIDKQGNKTFYGGVSAFDATSVITDSDGDIAHWAITRTQDPYGNYIEYTYASNTSTIFSNSTVTAKEFYPEKIRYTKHASTNNYYEIEFKRNNYLLGGEGSVSRSDAIVTGRNGFLQVTDELLTEVYISLVQSGQSPQQIRSYRFDYGEMQFKKQQLVKISEYDSANQLFYTNTLEYYQEGDYNGSSSIIPSTSTLWSGGQDNFALPLNKLSSYTDGLFPNGSPLGTSASSGMSFGLRVGFGIGSNVTSIATTAGGSFNYSRGSQDGKISLVDLNGDGLPDKLFKDNGSIFYRKNTGSGFAEPVSVTGAIVLSETKFSTTGAGADVVVGFSDNASIGVGKSWSKTKSETDNYFTDFNGDGLTDLISEGRVWFNNSFSGNQDMRKFEDDVTLSENIIESGPVDQSIIPDLKLPTMDELRDEHPQFDHVKVWVAPYTGEIDIQSTAILTTFDIVQGQPNSFKLTLERSWSSQIMITHQLSMAAQTANFSYSNLQITKGDKLFFRIHNQEDGYGGEIEWNPKITYITMTDMPLPAGDDTWKQFNFFDAEQDFIVNNDGKEQIQAGSVTIHYDLPSISIGMSDDVNFVIKKIRTKLEDGSVTILDTWSRIYDHTNEYYPGGSDSFTDYISTPNGYKDEFYFSVESNSNIDWGAIKWQPYYIDSNSDTYYPGIDYITYDNNLYQQGYWIESGSLIQPVIDNTYDEQTDFMQLSHNLFNYEPQLNNIPEDQFPLEINWVTKSEIGNSIKVIKTKKYYIYKNVYGNYVYTTTNSPYNIYPGYNAVTTGYDDILDISKKMIKDIIDAGGKIYSAFYIKDTRLAHDGVDIKLNLHPNISGYSFNQVVLKRPFLAAIPQIYGLTYRGWGQFLYNGGLKFSHNDEGGISGFETNFGDAPIELSLFDAEYQGAIAGGMDFETAPDPNTVSVGNNVVRYAFYNSKNEEYKHINEAIVTAEYGINGSDKLTARVGRFGEENLFDLYIEPSSLLTANPGVFVGMKQRSLSKGSAVSGNVGLGIGADGTDSKATSEVLNQYLDLNGDRYPDIVTKGKIQFTNMLGALSATSISNTNQFVPADDSNDFTFGVTIAPMKPNSTGKTPGGEKPTNNSTNTNVSAGINDSSGTTQNAKLWIDMNGDGLPDKVRVNGGSVDAWLNTGYGFSDQILWGSNYSGLVASSRNNTGVGANFSFGQSYAFGFGAAVSTANVNTMIIDVNGDGLPDLLVNSGGSYIYYLNTGKNFAAQPKLFYGGSKVEEDTSIAGNIFGAYTYGIPIPLLVITLKITFTGSLGFNASYNEKLNTIQDINGDGFPDVLTKANSTNNSAVSAKLSTIGRTYLLKKVNTPLGGSWTIDYKRDGNTYDMPNSKWVVKEIRTHDGFTADNTYKPDATLTTVTYANPKYDRREREFYGYETVSIEQKDPANNTTYRKQVKSYHNENYYLSGAEKATMTYNQSGLKLSETTTLFNLLNPDSPVVNMNATADHNFLQSSLIANEASLLDQSRLFIAVAKTSSTSYENGQGLTAVKEFINYDNNGNITTHIDRGEGPNDAYRTVIEYYPSVGGMANTTGFPRKISVFKNSSNQLFRQRAATYNNLGKLSQITTKLNQTEDNRISFGYNAFGNLTTVTDVDNLNASSNPFVKTIGYDTVLSTYPVTVSNSFGETSSLTYNYLFGIPVLTEDTNHQFMRTRIDNRGRVVEVTGPNEMALESSYSSAWTIRTQYKGEDAITSPLAPNNYMLTAKGKFEAVNPGTAQPTASQHYALTRHFDSEYANGTATTSNELKTVSIVDGLGQGIQVKKTHPSGMNVWMVSGFDVRDAFGRTLKSYLPATQGEYPANLNYYAVSPSSLPDQYPVVMTYDDKDRVITVKQPGESQSAQITYAIEGGMFAQKTTNEKSQTLDTYTDIRGRQRKTVQNGEITTKFNYNAINELLQVVDNDGFKTGYIYDMAGRKIEMQHPDRGVVTFKYDRANRMIEQSNSNLLLAGGQVIKYYYDFSRLTLVEYPQNPLNNVEYTYGSPLDMVFAVPERAVGRLMYQKDASGVQVFGYGRMGEVTKNLRSVAVAGFQPYWFLTRWKYDSWNRVQEIVYPDQENVSYIYNLGGSLDAINSEIYGIPNVQPIITSIIYNGYGERTQLERGNGTVTTYSYDARRRMNNVSNSFTNFNISNNYTYDVLSNITDIVTQDPNSSLPPSGQLGGPIVHHYDYDTYNRLSHAAGVYTGPNDETTPYLKEEYDLVMQYNTDHTIKKKTQSVYQGTVASLGAPYQDQAPVYKNSYILDYSDYKKGAFVVGNYGYLQPHAPRTIVESPSWAGSVSSDDPRVRHKLISYDANGNQTEIKEQVGTLKTSLRKNLWDEENRLTAVNLKPDEPTDHPIAIYTYDAGGERIVRYNMDRMDVSSNADEVAQSTKENVMLYPSGLLMGKALHSSRKADRIMTYTKHYYIGSERISAKTGTSNMGFYPKNNVQVELPTLDEAAIKTVAAQAYTDAETRVTGVYAKFSQEPPVFTPNEEDGATGYDHNVPDLELNIYYFHPDHLGSSAYISNAAGVVTQHMEYLPFGETLVDEHTNSFNSPFKYNGKEFDEETGNYYYGARYYDPKWSIFISVDPLAEKTGDAYGYCYQNPIKFTDPTGMAGVDGDNPIYDQEGNFLGTDDRGLTGKGIVMQKENFTQGMSGEVADKMSIGAECFNNPEAMSKASTHHANLKNRPDFDGELTFGEAKGWYQEGSGKALYVDSAKIGVDSVETADFEEGVGSSMYNNFFGSTNGNTALIYGNMRMTLEDAEGTVTLGKDGFLDIYDFDQRENNSLGNMGRNAATKGGEIINGSGTGYKIYTYGKGKVTKTETETDESNK